MTTRPRQRTGDIVSREEVIAAQASEWSEAALQSAFIAAAGVSGVRFIYHTHDSRRSQAGFPDLILLHGARALAIEFKRERDRTSPERRAAQAAWLAAFDAVDGFRSYLFRPSSVFEGEVEKALLWLTGREGGILK